MSVSLSNLLTVLLPLARDILVAVAAVVGACVAIKGFQTWTRQLKTKSEYDLARRLFRGVLCVRDRLQGARNPVVPADFEDKRKAFDERLSAVRAALREVEPDFLEAEALWGDSVVTARKALGQVHGKLMIRVAEYLRLKNPEEPHWQMHYSQEQRQRLDENLFGVRGDDDPYRRELDEVVAQFKAIVQPRLAL